MIRIYETHTEFLVEGAQHNERDNVSILDAVIAVTVSLELNFVVEAANQTRLVLKIEGAHGKTTVVEYTGRVRHMKPLLEATFIQSVFRYNMRGQEVLRNLVEDRDALQDRLIDLHEGGADWKKLALGFPMGLTDVGQMIALYEKVLTKKHGYLHAVDIKA